MLDERPPPSANTAPLSRRQALWLAVAGIAASAPLAPYLPIWLAVLTGLTFVWRLALAWWHKPLPPRWSLILVAVAGLVGIVLHYRTPFGQNPGVALLVMLMALKQLECRARRDGLAVVFLGFFIVMGAFFYAQTMPAALFAALALLMLVAALAALEDDLPDARPLLARASLLLLEALPFMLLLFVLFPRVQGPLWGLPRDAHSALTGLSDSMTPGSISQLSQSDAIAFRVRFAGEIPPRHQLYWRGPVLTHFDGRTWRPLRQAIHDAVPYDVAGREVSYELTLEPHNKHWLFTLELPGEPPTIAEGALATDDYFLVSNKPIVSRLRYTLSSFPETIAGADEPGARLAEARQLPPRGNPRIRETAAHWRAMHGEDDHAILEAAIVFFLRQGLRYTLEPPLTGENSVDEFLFETKEGFCEHFSSAFVFALRAAGVPARVVTGYQGGEINPVDGYMVVHQYDAHAWTEVWLRGEGWRRIDPTAISVPTRVQQNLAAAVPEGSPLPYLVRTHLAWLRDLRFRWDALNNAWNQWVLGYNVERQRDFLRRLGMSTPDWRHMTALLAVLTGLTFAVLALFALRQWQRRDAAGRLWQRAQKHLARRGYGRLNWEAPGAWAARVAQANPALGETLNTFAEGYSRLRYAPLDDQQRERQLQELRQTLSALLDRLQTASAHRPLTTDHQHAPHFPPTDR